MGDRTYNFIYIYINIHALVFTQTGWTTTASHVSVSPWTTPVGPRVPASRDPLEMFSHYFDEEVLSLIVRETNRFAAQCLAAANRTTTWQTDMAEIKAYFGFMVVMGVNRLPEIRDYWASDEKLHNTFIASRITRDRFEEITRYLHFIDNTGLPLRDEPGFHRLQTTNDHCDEGQIFDEL